MGGFRFDGAPEPAAPIPFVAQSQIGARDLAVDLRDAAEAPQPAAPHALRRSVEDIAALRPAEGQRVVLCCRTGLRAWRAATALRAVWPGAIALAAIPPSNEG